jgi:methionyl-tRNA formyltransferase
MNVCIAGKNNIAVEILDHLIVDYPEHDYLACLNQNDSGKDGFQRSLKKYCALKQVQTLTLEEVCKLGNLVFLSLEFDKIVRVEKFKEARLYNIHFSMLPAYKGMSTCALPILHNQKSVGVTLHLIDNGIDTGDIIAQREFLIGDNTDAQQLYGKFLIEGIELVKENLAGLLADTVSSAPQPSKNASYYSKHALDFSNLQIDLNKTAQEIHNQIRAYCFSAFQLPKVFDYAIYRSELTDLKRVGKSGTIAFENGFYLLINGIDYQVQLFKDRAGELMDYCKHGDFERLLYFAENGYDIRQRSKEGWDALILAGLNGHLALVTYLIEKLQWDVNTRNNNGTTFAMYVMTYASKQNTYELFKYVLNLPGINWDISDYSGKNIFDYAVIYSNQKVIDLLEAKRITSAY